MSRHASHARPNRDRRAPPPAAGRRAGHWEQLPPANRRRVLGLLSRLLERQLRPPAGGEDAAREDGHEPE